MKRVVPFLACWLFLGCSANVVVDGSVSNSDGGGVPDPEPQDFVSCVDEVLAEDPDGAVSPVMVEGAVYWATADGAIFRRAPGQALNTELVAGLDGAPSLAVREPHVYFAEGTTVSRFHQGTEQIEVLATEQSGPFAPTHVGDTLYWLNRGSGILAGELMRWRAGNEPEVVIASIHLPVALTADAANVYVAADMVIRNDEAVRGPLLRVVDETGAWDVALSGINQPAGIAATDDKIFWIDQVDDTFSTPGTVGALDKLGGATESLASIDGLGVMAVADADQVFFSVFGSETSRVRQVTPDDGEVKSFVELPGSVVGDLAMDEEHVVVTSSWTAGTMDPGTPSVQRLCRNDGR